MQTLKTFNAMNCQRMSYLAKTHLSDEYKGAVDARIGKALPQYEHALCKQALENAFFIWRRVSRINMVRKLLAKVKPLSVGLIEAKTLGIAYDRMRH